MNVLLIITMLQVDMRYQDLCVRHKRVPQALLTSSGTQHGQPLSNLQQAVLATIALTAFPFHFTQTDAFAALSEVQAVGCLLLPGILVLENTTGRAQVAEQPEIIVAIVYRFDQMYKKDRAYNIEPQAGTPKLHVKTYRETQHSNR